MLLKIYSFLHWLLLPFIYWRLKYRSRLDGDYGKNISERLGKVNCPVERPVWIHAVSVGETMAIAPLVERLLSEDKCPVFITSTTPAGRRTMKRMFGDRVCGSYAPYDIPLFVRQFLLAVDPKALLLVETEIWPNWICEAEKLAIPVLLLNARLSERSASRYAKISSLTSDVMSKLHFVGVQYEEDAKRFFELGVPENKLEVVGNLKADIHLLDSQRELAMQFQSLSKLEKPGPCILVASTHPGEDEIMIEAFALIKNENPSSQLVIAPRHIERSSAIAKLVEKASMRVMLRSSDALFRQPFDVLIADQMGELIDLMGMADIVVMGGTICDYGGHNPLEAAAWAKATLVGPYRRNFISMYDELLARAAAIEIDPSPGALANAILENLNDREGLKQSGIKARDYLVESRGAIDSTLNCIRPLLVNKSL